jgi:hypothetical protein
MALEIEGVVDGGVHAEKRLDGARRLEPLYLALSPSRYLMRVFGAVLFFFRAAFAHAGRSVADAETWRRKSAAYQWPAIWARRLAS